jgi:hypothetical protein
MQGYRSPDEFEINNFKLVSPARLGALTLGAEIIVNLPSGSSRRGIKIPRKLVTTLYLRP